MNRANAIMAVMLAGGAVLVAGCPRGGPGRQVDTLGRPQYFTVSLSQAGRSVAIVNNQATLRRGPFSITVSLPRWGGVMVNASTRPALARAVLAGRSAGSVAPVPVQGLPEGLFNPRKEIFVSDSHYNYWYYFGPNNHCFDTMTDVDGRCVCERRIETFGPDAASPAKPISELPGAALYLTFVKADLAGSRRSEKHAEAVKIVWND